MNQQMRALIIEDDADLRASIDVLLSSHGIATRQAESGEIGIEMAKSWLPDVYILDVDLPGINGTEVCRRLRSFSKAPILFLTGATTVADEIVGFAAGADDYIAKPFTPQLLVARVHAHLLRGVQSATTPRTIRAANVVIDMDARSVVVDGIEVELTKIEYEMIAVMAENIRRIISRDQLIEAVWGPWFSDDHILDVNLSRLRSKLAKAGAPAKLISTHRGLGVRLNP